MALERAAFRAEAGDGSNVAINLDLNIRAVDERKGDLGGLDQLNLLGLIDHFAVVRDAGKLVAEDGVENGGVVELDGASKTLFEIGDGLAVGFLIGFPVILSKDGEGGCEKQESEQGQLFHNVDSGLER